MFRILVISHPEAEGRLKDIYDDLVKKRGKLADIHQIQSLRPESIVKHMELYLEIMFTPSPLTRAQREMIAVVVSVANGCQYCHMHHMQALQHYVKDADKLGAISNWPQEGKLSQEDAALCDFAKHLTLHPQDHENNDYTENLRIQGFSDKAILDTVLVVSYFNFVNRIALSLGLKANEEEMAGYKY